MNLRAAAPKEQPHGDSRRENNIFYIFRKAVNKMTKSMTLTGSESSSELMELRRDIVKARRQRRATMILGGAYRPEKSEGDIIRFPSSDFPLIA